MNKSKVIAIANQKGGVGKATTTLNLAIGLVRHGATIMMLDVDPQASFTVACGKRNPDELFPNV